MIIHKIYLVTRNARDKVQVAIAELVQNTNSFTIKRTTGQYQGKMTAQAEKIIDKGKAKRTILQQAELEFNSIVKKYLDRGYKRLDSLTDIEFKELLPEELDSLVPTLKSDAQGNLKPMLAKSSDSVQNSVLNKPMFVSKKLDGVRCMMKYVDGKVVTISRGGKNYDASTVHITKELEDLFKLYPDIILDGELYRHGMHLQEISGIARLETWEDRCNKLQYWIYDIADGEKDFNERLDLLIDLKLLVEDKKYENIFVLEHEYTESWSQIQKLHDKWVQEGFEGAVARKPFKVYGFGKRGSDMIKIKMYKDDEFLIVDYKDGLRDEDFCFICETPDGKPFAAKPMGTREQKAEYLDNIDNIIGKMGTVKYFDISKDGIPLQPVFKTIRYNE